MRIYFAGPLFTQAEWIWNTQLAGKLRGLGIDVVLPQERSEIMMNGEEPFSAKTLFEANTSSIDRSDVVLAILDQADADSGTCWECGYAFASGKPIIGVRTDLRMSAGDDGALNLMLTRSCTTIVQLPLKERSNVEWLVGEIMSKLATVANRP